jgi:hypothetical protein
MMTYKHWIWSILFWVGVVVYAVSTIEAPADYGIPATWMPYIKLAGFIAAAVGGKLGISYLKGKTEVK